MTVGIIGGGQLGLMLVEELRRAGLRSVVLDPSPEAPAFALCDERIVAPFDDAAAVEELCRRSDTVGYEFENIPFDVLEPLAARYRIPEGFRPLCDAQDRLREKENARRNGLETPAFAAADDEASLRRAVAAIGFPCVVKTRTLGYDGHGQAVLHSEAELPKALPLLAVPCIVEQFVPFDCEASVVLVRDGERTIHFPVGRNVHRDGILDLCYLPSGLPEELTDRMVAASEAFMERCGYRGILAIEYFVAGDRFYFNEMAPRPHNSGHYTIEGCTTNQFREWMHFLTGAPLEQPRLTAPTVMKNILGRDLGAAEAIAAEPQPGPEAVHVHLYGKRVAKPLRKMGHITFTNLDEAGYDARWRPRFV